MIVFEKYDALIDAYTEIFNVFNSQLENGSFEDSLQNIEQEANYTGDFGSEFRGCLFNNPKDDPNLKIYIERVYYEGVMYLLIAYGTLGKRYFQKHGATREYIAIIDYYHSPLSLLAGFMRKEAYRFRIVNLRDIDEVNGQDYWIGGEYKPIFNWFDYAKVGQDNELNNESNELLENLNKPQAIIKGKYFSGFLKMFAQYFDSEDYPDLELLLKGNNINRSIHFKGQSVLLTEIFRRATNAQISNFNTRMGANQFIVNSFTYKNRSKGIISPDLENVKRDFYNNSTSGSMAKLPRNVLEYFNSLPV